MQYFKFFLIILMFLSVIDLRAQEATDSLQSSANLSKDSSEVFAEEVNSPELSIVEQLLETKITGSAEADNISFYSPKDNGKIYSRNQALVFVNLDSKMGSKTRMFSSIEFREDLSNASRNRVFLQEAYLDVFLNKLDLRIGKQKIIWGAADGINYTSNINPINFSDLLDLRYQTIGVFSVKGLLYLKDWTLTGVLVPVFNPTILPSQNSPWFIEQPGTIANPINPSAELKASYNYMNGNLPPRDFRSAQYAARLAKTFGKIDVSISYYKGYNDLPIAFVSVPYKMTQDSVFISIQPEYRKWQVIGADFSTVIGKIGLRGEGAYFITDDRNRESTVRNYPYMQYVIGLDRRFDKLFILFQWMHQVTTHDQKFSDKDFNHIFQKSLMGRVEYSIGDFTKVAVKGFYNLGPQDYYIQPEISYQITSSLNCMLRTDILGGSSDGFFGQYKMNNRFQGVLKYNF